MTAAEIEMRGLKHSKRPAQSEPEEVVIPQLQTLIRWIGAIGGTVLTVVLGFQYSVDQHQWEAISKLDASLRGTVQEMQRAQKELVSEVRLIQTQTDQRQDVALSKLADSQENTARALERVSETVRMMDEHGTRGLGQFRDYLERHGEPLTPAEGMRNGKR